MIYGDPVHYILNKEDDFEKGYRDNIEITHDGISVKKGNAVGVFISKFYDSHEENTIWNRLLIKQSGNGIIKLTYYSANSIFDLKNAIESNNLSIEEINALIEPFKIKTVVNPFDILIHDAGKRFFLFKIEILNLKENKSIVHSIKIEYPIQSFLRYLPEVYQADEESRKFLEGYLGIFQSLYMDLEKTIDSISSYFDPDITDKEFLDWLAKWVKIENTYIWTEDKLRYLLKNITKFYEKAGTTKGISDIIELYADEKPYIIEYFHIKKYINDYETYNILSNLYSDNPYEFTVILSEKSIPSEKEYKELYKLINEFKPAHIEVKLVILKPNIFLGSYSYLGINSYLNNDRSMQLDGFSAVSFTKLDK